jgi:hypothetical protein
MAGNGEFADLEKPALLTSSVKAVLADSTDFSDQKGPTVAFRARPLLSDTDQKFLLLHALFRTYPRAGTAMCEQRLK